MVHDGLLRLLLLVFDDFAAVYELSAASLVVFHGVHLVAVAQNEKFVVGRQFNILWRVQPHVRLSTVALVLPFCLIAEARFLVLFLGGSLGGSFGGLGLFCTPELLANHSIRVVWSFVDTEHDHIEVTQAVLENVPEDVARAGLGNLDQVNRRHGQIELLVNFKDV